MNHPQLPLESDQKQKDFYLQLRDKVGERFEKNADQKLESAIKITPSHLPSSAATSNKTWRPALFDFRC